MEYQGTKNTYIKNGKIVRVEDTRELPFEKIKMIKELNDELKKILSETDWEIIRSKDPTSNKPLKQATVDLRNKARNLALSIEDQIQKSTSLSELEKINIYITKTLGS
jgi:hypothetical protein